MKERPILFSAPMVRAILDGKKTQTRRIVKVPKWLQEQGGDLEHPETFADLLWCVTPGLHVKCTDGTLQRLRNPWGFPDVEPIRLWVRETFVLENNVEYRGYCGELPTDGRPIKTVEPDDGINESYDLIPHYRATDPDPHIVPFECESDNDDRTRWNPSIFMPRWASRITLELTDVRVERLQDISRADAAAEGMCYLAETKYTGKLPDGTGAWDKNPWVWVVEFQRCA
jgi:hypothetical protein